MPFSATRLLHLRCDKRPEALAGAVWRITPRYNREMFFSQRKGFKPTTKVLQVDEIDQELRNRLWTILSIHLLKQFEGKADYYSGRSLEITGSNLEALLRHYWHALFKQPIDTMPEEIDDVYDALRTYFFKCRWYEVYDYIEFTLRYCPDKFEDTLRYLLNEVLEQENAAYRITGETIVEITSPEELTEVDAARLAPVSGARAHLASAVALLADRKKPDYRNSIKESISAVEAVCKAVTGNDKATMGDALKTLQSKVGLHAALKSAFSNLYGYTSDADGIRHAMLEEPNLTFADAKFMLVACSAFVNYIVGKATEAGVKLKK